MNCLEKPITETQICVQHIPQNPPRAVNPPRAILFDCDGLLDSKADLPQKDIETAFQLACIIHQLDPEKYTKNYKDYIDMPAIQQFTGDQFAEFTKTMAEGIDYSAVKADMEMFLCLSLINKFVPVSLISNHSRAHLDEIVRKKFKHSLDSVLSKTTLSAFSIEDMSCSGALYNKEKGGFKILCDKIRVDPHQVLLIERNSETAEVARRLGMKTILITRHENPTERLRLVYNSLRLKA